MAAEMKWISVADRLPDAPGEYLVVTLKSWSDRKEPFRVMLMEYVARQLPDGRTVTRWQWNGKVSMWRVSHWMPLPEMPKEGKV